MLENAKWVTFDGEEAPRVRGEFNIKDYIENAELEICGLGSFYLYLNGKLVNEEVFPTLWSDYHRRNITGLLYEIPVNPIYRIYVSKYDVTKYLTKGTNLIALLLGNGWYGQHERTVEGYMEYGKPTLCYRLTVTYKDGKQDVFCSDEMLKWSPSHIVFNNLFLGEVQDLQRNEDGWNELGYDDSAWNTVMFKEKPEAILMYKNCPGDCKIRTVPYRLIAKEGQKSTYACYENITGWVKLRLKGKKGDKVTITYAEEINEDNSLNFDTTGTAAQIQRDCFICSGEEKSCEPYFTWHGFQYFSIEGEAEPLECVVVHADIANRTEFECDNKVLNWLYNAFVRTQLTNMHMGVPSDCPHRERLGYTGDGQVACGAAMYILDVEAFYKKWIRDILDCQDQESGRIQHTAPFYGGGGGIGGWGCAVIVVPYKHYEIFRDKEVLLESWAHMQKWIKYMFSQTENDLVLWEEKASNVKSEYWNLGDWCTPMEVRLPRPFVNTYFLIKSLLYMREIAQIINVEFVYENQINKLKNALNEKYYDKHTHTFCDSVQGADAFALDIGLGDTQTEQSLVERYKESKEVDTGIFGTYILLDVLFRKGYIDEAIELMSSDKENSFAHMMKHGATTLWERWDGDSSHNHPMFGGSTEHIFRYIIGVRFQEGNKVIIQPAFTKLLKHIKATVKTKTGVIKVEYLMNDDKVGIEIIRECNETIEFMYNGKSFCIEKNNNELYIELLLGNKE